MRFKRVYIEITNVCNLKCEFCKPHNRQNRFMTLKEFNFILDEIKNYTEYIYLHVKGEPLLHPNFDEFVKLAFDEGFKINLTTNATLLKNHLKITKYLRQINVSFHATNSAEILKTCKSIDDCIINFRIWNYDENSEAINQIQKEFNISDISKNFSNYTLANNIFLSVASKFEWPDMNSSNSANGYCHALKDQIAILVDGTVVPCCLDNDGDINLGNIFNETLSQILEKERTQNILDGFKKRIAVEPLCQKCTFKARFWGTRYFQLS